MRKLKRGDKFKMRKIRKFFQRLTLVLTVLMLPIFVICAVYNSKFPNSYNVTTSGKIDNGEIFSIQEVNSGSVEGECKSDKNYLARLMFFNLIPIKEVNVNIIEEMKVIPCGVPFGVKIFTEGVMVIALTDVATDSGVYNPAKKADIKKGDVIVSINGMDVHSNDEIAKIVECSNGQVLSMHVKRFDDEFDTTLEPIKSSQDGLFKAGMWVRDSSAGIGMLTFVEPKSKMFAGLGHGICDVDTQELLPLSHGDIVASKITGIKSGKKGVPGELRGEFESNNSVGILSSNTETGVYGVFEKSIELPNQCMMIAMKQQVKTGPAKVITTVDGNVPKEYNINVVSVNYNPNTPTKNMVIEITDEELLEKTGGIVQGMSGSPIVCDGMVIGSVTHVFVNNPKKGYAIFAETMLQNCRNVSEKVESQVA